MSRSLRLDLIALIPVMVRCVGDFDVTTVEDVQVVCLVHSTSVCCCTGAVSEEKRMFRLMARPAGIEPATVRLEVCCSIR